MSRALRLALLTAPLLASVACRRAAPDDDPELCGDDPYAPNAIRGEAFLVEAAALDAAGAWTATALPLCQGDEDWFAIEASAGQRIVATIAFPQAEGDLQLDLVSELGTVLDSSQSITDDEHVDFAVLDGGTYYLRVWGAEPGTGNTYDLALRLVGEPCAPDAFEPNDVSLDAAPLPVGATDGLTVCFGEEDWFEIAAEDGQVVVVDAQFDPLRDDLDLRLYREADSGALVWLANGTPTEGGVQLVRQVSGSGPFLAQVIRGPDTLTGQYQLDVSVSGEGCAVDLYEPNDGYLDATPLLGDESVTGLSLCVGDQDWYEIDVANGELLEVSAAFDHDEVDIGVNVYKLNPDRTLTYRTGSNTLSDDEIVRYRPYDDGTFVILVYPTRGTVTGAYDLAVDVSGTACADDSFEPNDAYAEATAISPGQYGEMTLCVGDDDWFTVDVANGQLFRATIGFDHEANDLGLWLYKLNADGTLTYRAGSDTLSDNETVAYRPFDGGAHVVRVGRTRGTVVATYGLDLAVTGDACVPDAFEPNDAYPEAQPIEPGEYADHTLCIGDADWYEIEAQNGQVVQIDVDFSHAANDLGLALYKLNDDGSISGRASSDTLSDGESLRYRVFESGTFLVYVYRTRGTQLASYDLAIDVVGEACVDDAFEPNDQYPQAVPVPLQPVQDISLCVGDADWYSVDLLNGQVLDARIAFSQAQSDLGLRVYQLADDGTIITRATADTLSDDERLLYTPFEDGTYLLQVYRSRGTQLATYDLDVAVRGEGCVDDPFEPNDAYSTAAPLSPGVHEAQTMCVGDADWYTFDAINGQLISVDLDFVHADNDLGVRLYAIEEDGTVSSRVTADTLSDNEFIRYRPYETGAFALYVFRSRGTVVAEYDLSLGVDGPGCQPDAFEPNDHWLQAPRLPLGTAHAGLGACVADQDYYDLGPIAQGRTITATATFSHLAGDLGMQLFRFNPDGSLYNLVTADSVTDDEIAVFTVPEDPAFHNARYGVRVYLTRGTPVAFYGLRVDVSGG